MLPTDILHYLGCRSSKFLDMALPETEELGYDDLLDRILNI